MEKTSYDIYKNFECQSKASINASDSFKEIKSQIKTDQENLHTQNLS